MVLIISDHLGADVRLSGIINLFFTSKIEEKDEEVVRAVDIEHGDLPKKAGQPTTQAESLLS
jgi:hypothetical protein